MRYQASPNPIRQKIEATGLSYKGLEAACDRKVKAGTWGFLYRGQLAAISDNMIHQANTAIDQILADQAKQQRKYARNRQLR